MIILMSLLIGLAAPINDKTLNDMEFEHLLGKSVAYFEEAIGSDFENKTFRENFYYIDNELIHKYLYNTRYHAITIEKNEEETVRSISIHFRQVINRAFYDSFVEKYGKPDQVYIEGKRTLISKSLTKDEHGKIIGSASKGESDLTQGTFDEQPLFMIWEKEGYYIQAFLRHKQNICEIEFSIDSPRFNLKPKKKP